MKGKNIFLVLLGAAIVLLNGRAATGDDNKGKALVRAFYNYHENECLKMGWRKVLVKVGGIERKILWKAPPEKWTYGAIIALHGGGGAYSNFGSNLPLGAPMVEFADSAISQGFALFSLESTWGKVTDSEGRDCGKRWDCIPVLNRENIDLPFIERVLADIIPGLRPAGSGKALFMTGISNGGFMTVLAATHFADRIAAFAVVSAGDPYGTYMDMGTHPRRERMSAPGVFRDNETNIDISRKGAAHAQAYPREKAWPVLKNLIKPVFKQFHHRGDAACDISCMDKARLMLVRHGYSDAGPFILDDASERSILNHFWNKRYNEPLLDFFKTRAQVSVRK